MAGNAARELASLTALDEEGRALTLGTFWAARAAVVVFVRHFG